MKKLIMNKRIIPLLWLGGAYFLTILSMVIVGERFTDSDMASEMILARILLKEEGIVSKNWYYSTELRVLDTQLIHKLALSFFRDWHAARVFSVAFLLLILVITYLLFTDSINLGQMGVITASVLVMPFSKEYLNIGLHGHYYTVQWCIYFLILGVSYKYAYGQFRRKEASRILTGVCMILSFLGGLGGVRYLLTFFAPFIVASFIYSIPLLRIGGVSRRNQIHD